MIDSNHFKAIELILDRSLFVFLAIQDHEALLRSSWVSCHTAGSIIIPSNDTSELLMVMSGGVYISRQGEGSIDHIGPGKSLELKSVMTSSQWEYQWTADNETFILHMPSVLFLSLLKKDMLKFRYLEMVTTEPFLQKLKIDLLAFNISKFDIMKLIVGAQRLEGDKIHSFFKNKSGFFVFISGTATVKEKFGRDLHSVRTIGPSEWFYHISNSEYEIEPTSQTCAYVIGSQILTNLSSATSIQQLTASMTVLPIRNDLNKITKITEIHEPKIQSNVEQKNNNELEKFYNGYLNAPRAKIKTSSIVRQHDRMDCGAACLATISAMYGRHISLEVFRQLAGVSQEGTSLLKLKIAAEKVGFIAYGVAAKLEELAKLRPPFIGLMGGHFVVISMVTENRIKIYNPSSGVRFVPLDQFKSNFSQVILLLYPSEEFFEYPESPNTFFKYFDLLVGYRHVVFLILILGVLSFFLALAPPLFLQILMDSILAKKNFSALWIGTAIVGGAGIISLLVDIVKNYLSSFLASGLEAKLSSIFMTHICKLPLKFFATRRVGDFTTRLDEISRLRNYLATMIIDNSLATVKVLLFSTVIGVYSFKILLFISTIAPVYTLLVYFVSPHLKSLLQDYIESMAKIRTLTFEQMTSFSTLKAIHGSTSSLWRWNFSNAKGLQLRDDLATGNALFMYGGRFITDSYRLIAILMALHEFTNGNLSIGQAICIGMLVNRVIDPMVELIEEYKSVVDISVSMARVNDVLTSQKELNLLPDTPLPAKLNGSVCFENVSFSYGGEKSNSVLTDINFKVQAGQVVGIIGLSGSGKSTLAQILNLLYQPTKGRVLIDGLDISKLPLAFVRKQVTIVFQETYLFSGTVAENIALGDDVPAISKVIEAAVLADAHEFISQLSNGYSTKIGDMGQGLSGGQVQRINIARALYRQSPIVVFDESTSALDALTEHHILKKLYNTNDRPTTIIIAHRMSAVKEADLIICLDKGRVVEIGTPSELLKQRGQYFDLLMRQTVS